MERTFAVLDHDVRTEEDELLPRMQELLGPRRLRLIGWQWELVRRISPTRPHPVVSRRPPGQVLSALPLTVLDRARDLLQRLDQTSHRRVTAPISTADPLPAATRRAPPPVGPPRRSRPRTGSWRRPPERSSGFRCCSGASGPRPAADRPPRVSPVPHLARTTAIRGPQTVGFGSSPAPVAAGTKKV